MLLAEQRVQDRAETLLRTTTEGIHLLVQLLDIEARHQLLGEFADMPNAGSQVLPFTSFEKRELCRHVGGYIGTAEVKMRHRGCKRIDIGRKHVRFAGERVAEAALANLDLTD